jgi:DNA transformation protein
MPKRRSEFVNHVVETMRLLGPVEARAMFGGWGLYQGGLFFALVAREILYLKVDDESRADFQCRGLEPWVYAVKDGEKSVAMSYYQAPEESLESPAQMEPWARLAYGAALRAAARKKNKFVEAAAKKKRPAQARSIRAAKQPRRAK